ncbi:vWA domain-containing protein [Vibrio splendidus]|uniref:vWA domain-containing protein n=1 Tax=Vibrio splendidus TaxID=29497 RepID=UPI001E58B088|nr:VWA domain-containing protein [Vibrio splendidus]MCC4860503.1 VWA domain-containing protein [Vibrio splendidus]MDH5914966.1 VWA domain-containing protein [Vibrio splendidus]
MIEFEYPIAFALLCLPFAVYWLLPVYKESKSAIQVPFFDRLITVSSQEPSETAVKMSRRKVQWLLVIISYLALVVAIAKPMWVGEPIEQKKSAREIMVALDLSGSMSEEDFADKKGNKHDRLTIAKQVLREFAAQREHDRLGLILFADSAYVQAPFTEDINVWQSLLEDVELGYAGFQTAFGDAIGLSIAVFEQEQSRQRVMILLTDGDDTSSKMPPVKAAEIAAKYGVKIYTIAIGDPSTKGRYKMDLPTLEKVSAATGGQMFHAMDRKQLDQAYATIDQLEQQEFELLSHRPKHSLHHYAFGVCLVSNLLAALIVFGANLRRQRLHQKQIKRVIRRREELTND